MKKEFINILCVLLIGAFTVSCEKDKDTLKDAQKYFKDKKYEKALNIFLDYIDTDSSVARVGAGWCYLRLNELGQADTMFMEAVKDSLLDGFAGWSFTAWSMGSTDSLLEKAIERAYVVLNKDSGYVMDMDHDVDYRELIWVQAASYYQMGYYYQSVERIKKLDPAFNPDMQSPELASIILAKLESFGFAISKMNRLAKHRK